MKLVVGLGNPGTRYQTTRHNVGFLAIDRMMDAWHAGPEKKQSQGLVSAAQSPSGEKMLLIKPQTFMNLSGECVGALAGFYRVEPADIIVIHDELDLPALKLRIKTGGGAGGHNGLKSIDQHLGAQRTGYHRVRIGVGHPHRLVPPLPLSPADYVLAPFADAELKALDPVFDQVASAVDLLLQGKADEAMRRFNG